MQEQKIEKLERAIASLQDRVTKEDMVAWKQNALTKVLVLQLEIDLEQLKSSWANNRFSFEETERAQGQAGYIEGFLEMIEGLTRG